MRDYPHEWSGVFEIYRYGLLSRQTYLDIYEWWWVDWCLSPSFSYSIRISGSFFLGIIGDRVDTNGFMTSDQIQKSQRIHSSHSALTLWHIVVNPRWWISRIWGDLHIQTKTRRPHPSPHLELHLSNWTYESSECKNPTRMRISGCLEYSVGEALKNTKSPSRYNINRIRIHNTTTIRLFDDLLTQSTQK